MNIGLTSGPIWVLFGSLFVFGVLFNWGFHQVQRRQWADGYVWLFVVTGVLATIIPTGFFIGWGNVIVLLIAFCCSGLPMALGDIYRHVYRREQDLEELRKMSDG